MKKILAFSISLFFAFQVNAQYSKLSFLSDLPLDSELYLKSDFIIPQKTSVVILDSGIRKRCSCQFFTHKKDFERIIKPSDKLLIEKVSVKGVFDGSQTHVSRIYLKNKIGYFKLKCFSKRMLVDHALDFFNIYDKLYKNLLTASN